MALAGYRCLIRRGGAVTSAVSEAFTNVGGVVYQVTNSARRCLDPRTSWHLSDTSGTVPYANITEADFLFGQFSVASVSGTLRYTGSYIPLTTASEVVQEARAFSLSETNDLIDTTVFTQTGARYRRKQYGLADVSMTVDGLLSQADSVSLASLKAGGEAFVFEVDTGASTLFRAWAKFETLDRSVDVEGVVERSLTFTLDGQRDDATGFSAAVSDRLL